MVSGSRGEWGEGSFVDAAFGGYGFELEDGFGEGSAVLFVLGVSE